MAVLTDVVLVADGGDITAGRKTSTLTFGEFNVLLPEDCLLYTSDAADE